MTEEYTLSVIMPAHQEQGNLRGAVEYVHSEILKIQNIIGWEILIVDSLDRDGSDDGTPELADQLAAENNHVRVIHNHCYVNLGFKYFQGLKAARHDYFMMVPGKDTLHGDSLSNLLNSVGWADLIIGYHATLQRRPLKRRLISWLFVTFINGFFALRLKYYNGTTVIKTDSLRKLNLSNHDFAYMAEILVLLLKKHKASYIEVPFYTRGVRKYGKTQATNWNNVKGVAGTILRLIKKVYFERE